jgi:tetratricopeptide (TPR) repeat protein
MPSYQGKVIIVGGYFQPGPDVNYITLTVDPEQENPYGAIFHEYVHALTNDNTSQSATWFSEGLAEVYSTFEVTDGDKKVLLGKPIANHVFLLREKRFLSLAKLFAVDHGAPDYNETDKKGLFYAQSWALVHYLLLGNNNQHRPQFIRFLGMLSKDKPVAESFNEIFKTDYATLETELKDYIGRNTYPVQTISFEEKLEFDASIETAQISEAEWNYYLGDLVLHIDRAGSETYLQKAIMLDPNLAVAHASLGVAHMKAQRLAEARKSLERALRSGEQNHMVHYYYAYVLSREGIDANNHVGDFEPETVKTMREHLKKAIALAPNFPESYHLLALINMAAGEQMDETLDLINRAMSLSPGRQDFSFILAQVFIHQGRDDEARQILETIARSAAEPQLRANAQSLIEKLRRPGEK